MLSRSVSILRTLLVLVILVVALGRIVSTHGVFSQAWDEPAHIVCGMEWLEQGNYTYEAQHPPLARIAVAVGPFLAGARLPANRENMWVDGNKVLTSSGSYLENLTSARLGELPFFILAASLVWVWTRRLFGDLAAILALILFTTLPPVLGWAGFAYTDIPFTATLFAAVFAFTLWLERTTMTRSLMLGASLALAVLSKFSSFVFLPACIIAILLSRRLVSKRTWPDGDFGPRLKEFAGHAIVVFLIAFFLVWGGYRFSTGHVVNPQDGPHHTIDAIFGAEGVVHDFIYRLAMTLVVPAPELFLGIEEVADHNRRGHRTFLLGEIRDTGWWYYFPVAMGVKTPLAFLMLAAIGFFSVGRKFLCFKRWQPAIPAVCAIAILIVCMLSSLNLDIRHIVPIYPFLAVVAGAGALKLFEQRRPGLIWRAAAVFLISWQVVDTALVHPDYVSYFNRLAGKNPERVLLSHDGGQDLYRLSNELRALNIEKLSLSCSGNIDLELLEALQFPSTELLAPHTRATGWIAVSELMLKIDFTDRPPYDGFAWLEKYRPVTYVGKTIRLYYISDDSSEEIK